MTTVELHFKVVAQVKNITDTHVTIDGIFWWEKIELHHLPEEYLQEGDYVHAILKFHTNPDRFHTVYVERIEGSLTDDDVERLEIQQKLAKPGLATKCQNCVSYVLCGMVPVLLIVITTLLWQIHTFGILPILGLIGLIMVMITIACMIDMRVKGKTEVRVIQLQVDWEGGATDVDS